jgi:Spy/CpxP family protein refolding chaperone
MNNALKLVLFLLLVAAVAVVSCWLAGRAFHGGTHEKSSDAHQWIHRELNITEAQEKALEPVEVKYAGRRQQLTQEIRQANMALSRAILEDREYSPRVTAAIERIHRAQGELQKATMEHVFEMRPALRPEQYEKLLRSTADALQRQPD